MSKGKRHHARRGVGKKKAYRAPELTVHGNIGALTQAKAGSKSDGGGKPVTRATGTQA